VPDLLETTCPFCAILQGREPSVIVFEDDRVVAFLDRRPLFPGHTLVVPRQHFVTLGELPADEVGPLMRVVQATARAMESALGAGGSFIAVNNRVSQSVPHLHVHVVPRTKGDGLKGFFWPRASYVSDEARDEVASVVRAGIAAELAD
jgi:histidine triad (HIT) family protein